MTAFHILPLENLEKFYSKATCLTLLNPIFPKPLTTETISPHALFMSTPLKLYLRVHFANHCLRAEVSTLFFCKGTDDKDLWISTTLSQLFKHVLGMQRHPRICVNK